MSSSKRDRLGLINNSDSARLVTLLVRNFQYKERLLFMLGAKFCAKESGLARNRILLERAALCPWVVRNLAARAYVRLCINPKYILWAKSVQAGVKQVYTRVVLGENPWGERRPYAAVPARESQLGWPTQESVEVGEHPCWLHLCTWFTVGTRISAEMFSFIQSCRRRRIRIKKHLYLDFEPVITSIRYR